MTIRARTCQGPTSRGRRQLLKAATLSGLLAAVERHALLAQTAPDYKALVCIFQQGGNDGENMLIRYDTEGYRNYASIRTPASGIGIAQARLHPIQPTRQPTPLGFHPACRPLKRLFDERKLAVVANVGMLAGPSTKRELETGGAPQPSNLFSHSDQQRALQTADPSGSIGIGWGGRVADRLGTYNYAQLFPPLVLLDQWGAFGNGQSTVPLTVPVGAVLTPVRTLNMRVDALAEATTRQILSQQSSNVYETVARMYAEEGLASSSVASPLLQDPAAAVRPFFAKLSSSVALQLLNAALIIEGRSETQLRRQVFHVHHNNYDTHGSQPEAQHQLLEELSEGLAAFQQAMAALGLEKSVTVFTLSDFGRTFKPAANKGTDHGWGNYALVIGGAVKGGDFYGTLPVQALDGPDDLGNAGRWIPTTSLEQYGATLVRWFGLRDEDLRYVFPNIGAFPNTDLGFMG